MLLRWGAAALLAALACGVPLARAGQVKAQATSPNFLVTCRFDPPALAVNQAATLRVLIDNVPPDQMVNAFDVRMMARPNKSLQFGAEEATIGDFFYRPAEILNVLGPAEETENLEAIPEGALAVAAVMAGGGEAGSGELFSAPLIPLSSGELVFHFNEVILASSGPMVEESIVDCAATVYQAYYLPLVAIGRPEPDKD